MEQACQLALRGQGGVEPNPMVGCLLVRDGQCIAEGYHSAFGGPHAERVALSNLAGRSAEGATAYVSLEPCCHYGKTPPCTEALIEAKVARVCCAMLDPFEKVSGKGIDQLRRAGIQVDVGCGQEAARSVMAPYLKRLVTGMPFVIAKWAMSLDGKMATRSGDSRWISSARSREHAHRLRGQVDAIVVGSRTAHRDDPLLTARPQGPRVPIRVVVDSMASLSPKSQLVQTAVAHPVLVWASAAAPKENIDRLRAAGCQVETHDDSSSRLSGLLRFLAEQTMATNVLFEGGGLLLGGLFDQGLIDELQVYIAPKIIGGSHAIAPLGGMGVELVADGPRISVCETQHLDGDVFVRARLSQPGAIG